jgi:hypothetical protein
MESADRRTRLLLSRVRGATTESRCDRDPSRRSTVAIFGRGPTLLAPGSGTPEPQSTARARLVKPGSRGPDLLFCGSRRTRGTPLPAPPSAAAASSANDSESISLGVTP